MSRLWAVLLTVGALAAVVGAVFFFQGLGVLGPSSSYMVGDRSWVAYGLLVALGGVAAIYVGFRLKGGGPSR